MVGSSSLNPLKHQRPLTFLIEVVFALILLAVPAIPVHAIQPIAHLKQSVMVTDNIVTIGDLFENSGNKSTIAVFRAPNPGTKGHVSVSRIIAAVRPHGLKLGMTPAFSRVRIERESRIIKISQIYELIDEYLASRIPQDGRNRLEIKLPEDLKDIHLDPKVQDELTLSRLNWSKHSGLFTANFRIGSATPVIIKGTAILKQETIVATKTIPTGTIISADDVEIKLTRITRSIKKQHTSLEKIVGLAARRSLRKGLPIAMRDLEAPKLILKNQLVTIILETPGLILRAEGKALADAARGETVKVLNTQSKRVIHATAAATGLVTVSLVGNKRSGS